MGLHKRAERVYNTSALDTEALEVSNDRVLPCGCSMHLAKDDTPKPDSSRISEAFQRVIAWLHRTKRTNLKPEDLKTPVMRRLVNETTAVFSEAVDYALKERSPSEQLTHALKQSAYVFSGFKDYHLAREASELLVNENGGIKPFKEFLNDVKQLDETYNKNYLYSEYKFAVASAQSAEKWEQFSKDGDRYDLQYRTANDKRVRETHKELHGTTLPIDSKFWDDYFPPNGFGCRCTVVQVRKGKYPLSNELEAIAKGKEATQGSHEKMMRFNPGKRHSLFPPHNPYTISKCTGCSKSGFKLAKIPTNEQCAACKIVLEMKEANRKAVDRYNSYGDEWEKTALDEKSGGYLVTSKERIERAKRSKNEMLVFEKEQAMSRVYAKNGYKIEHLPEKDRVSACDIRVDGVLGELKKTKGFGNILNYAKKAIDKKGAKIVLFEFEEFTEEHRKEIIKLKRLGIPTKYFVTGEDIVYSL